MSKERQHLDSLAPSSSSSSSSSSKVKYREPPSYAWTQTVSPASLPQGQFTGGKEYVGRWRLPPPVQSEVAPAGDLMEAISSGEEGQADQPEIAMAQQAAARI